MANLTILKPGSMGSREPVSISRKSLLVVFTSPVYYFTMTAQMEAAIQRVYYIGKPLVAKKASLFLTSGSPGVYDAAIAQFKAYMGYAGIEAAGIITSNGEENGS